MKFYLTTAMIAVYLLLKKDYDMPISPIIGAASSILDTGLNALANATNNRQSREWNEKMHNLQRAEALADWNMQNEYNSPSSQMRRLKEAGLNPNLVYGNGADATSQGPVRSSDTGSWRPESTHFDTSTVAQSLASIYDIELKQAQTDNLKAQNTVAVQNAALIGAQTAKTVQDTRSSEFSLSQAEALKETSLEAAKEQLRKTKIENYVNLSANERAAALNASSLQKAAEEILTLRAQRSNTIIDRERLQQAIEGLRNDNTLKQLDIDLKKKGLQPSDELWQRMLSRMLGDSFDPKKIGDQIKDHGKKILKALERYGREGTIRFQY